MTLAFRLVPLCALILTACSVVSAQIKREVFAYKVKARPVVSIRNQYGRITVTPQQASKSSPQSCIPVQPRFRPSRAETALS